MFSPAINPEGYVADGYFPPPAWYGGEEHGALRRVARRGRKPRWAIDQPTPALPQQPARMVVAEDFVPVLARLRAAFEPPAKVSAPAPTAQGERPPPAPARPVDYRPLIGVLQADVDALERQIAETEEELASLESRATSAALHRAAQSVVAEIAAEYETTQLALAYLQGLLLAIDEMDDDDDVEAAAVYVARYLQ